MTDQGTKFTSDKVVAFTQQFSIKLIHSTPYYAPVNGQVEATNKIIIDLINKKYIEDKPKKQHETLLEALWVYRNTKNNVTTIRTFRLTYGQDGVLPLEVNAKSLRVTKQNLMLTNDYERVLIIELEMINEDLLMAYENTRRNKEKGCTTLQ